MPGLNFDYTKFLREQNEKYIKKYGKDPIKADLNSEPINGFSGHVPSYRGSLHELRVVRSLVRCINSPMKPTTATGYRTKSRQFYNAEDEEVRVVTPPQTAAKEKPKEAARNESSPRKEQSAKTHDRVRSAPAAVSRERDTGMEDEARPSDISMMAAGSSAMLKNGRPKTTASATRGPSRAKLITPRSPSGTSSIPPLRLPTPSPIPKHPTGYPQTLYGASYWYAWPGETPRSKDSSREKRQSSYSRDRRLTRNDGVLYHRHEGMVPKYLGYVPGYKFRHGSTFGVLTVNATSHGLAHRLAVKT